MLSGSKVRKIVLWMLGMILLYRITSMGFFSFFSKLNKFCKKLQFFLDFRALYNAESLINQQVIAPNNHYKIFNLYFFSFSKKERMNECSLITLTWCETWLRLSLRNSTTQIELKYLKKVQFWELSYLLQTISSKIEKKKSWKCRQQSDDINF